jgi:hypothetical protein
MAHGNSNMNSRGGSAEDHERCPDLASQRLDAAGTRARLEDPGAKSL